MSRLARSLTAVLLLTLARSSAAAVPAGVPTPESEIAAGHIKIFSSGEHAKAKGVALRIEYPESWKALEGRHPNVVTNLVSEGGRGLEMCVIAIKAIPPGEPVTPAEIDELLGPAGLRATVPPGAVFRSGRRTKINALPASMVRWGGSFENAGVSMRQETLHVSAICPRHVISLTFSVGRNAAGHDEAEVLAVFARFEKLFLLMANSVVVENQWR